MGGENSGLKVHIKEHRHNVSHDLPRAVQITTFIWGGGGGGFSKLLCMIHLNTLTIK